MDLRSAWVFVWSPVRFFERRVSQAPIWWWAGAALGLCVVLQAVATTFLTVVWGDTQDQLLLALEMEPTSAPPAGLFVLIASTAYPMAFAMALLALLAMNVLYRDVGEPSRLVECTALCFFTQLPFLGLLALATAGIDAPPLRLPDPATRADVVQVVERYRASLIGRPWTAVLDVGSYYSTAWLATQLTCVLRGAAGFSTRAAVVAGAFLLALFIGIDLLVAR